MVSPVPRRPVCSFRDPNFCAAAKILKAREAELPGTVVLLFQPAEEGGGGAPVMIAEGALEGVAGAGGLHVWPTTPSGTFTSRVRRGSLNPKTIKTLELTACYIAGSVEAKWINPHLQHGAAP